MLGQHKGNVKDTRIIGIDPSLRKTGICSIIDNKIETTLIEDGKHRGVTRLSILRRAFLKIINESKPDLAVMEGYSIGSINRPFDIGEWSGIIKVELFDRNIDLIVVSPMELKKFVVGKGVSGKRLVIANVAKKYGIAVKDDNLADAIGLAMIGKIYITRESKYRSELEVVRNLKKCVSTILTM